MLRQKLLEKTDPETSSFRIRGEEIQRIEGFSDAVFGFTVTLLVVSLEVPKTFTELLDTMHDSMAFAVTFALLVAIWYWQYLFFRRYALRDTRTVVLNAVLLFVVLLYAYPLKFLWKLIFDALLGYKVTGPNGAELEVVTANQGPLMMSIYGIGFMAVNLVLALMYLHAYRHRDLLELSPAERFDTISVGITYLLGMLVGLISILVALTTGDISISGYSYFLVPVFVFIFRSFRGNQRRKMEAEGTLSNTFPTATKAAELAPAPSIINPTTTTVPATKPESVPEIEKATRPPVHRVKKGGGQELLSELLAQGYKPLTSA